MFLSFSPSPQKLEEGQPSPSKPVFDKQPQPVEWHLTRNRDEYHILTVSTATLSNVQEGGEGFQTHFA